MCLRGGDGDVMGHLVDDIELLDGQLVYLVQHVNAWNVASIAFNHVNELVDRRIAATEYVAAHYLVLAANRVHDLVCEHRLAHHRLEVDGALIFAPECMSLMIHDR